MRTWHGEALQLFIAAAVALGLAWALGLENPYWAAMPVFVVSQPWRNDMLIRGVLRFIGTVIGAGVGLLLIHLRAEPVVMVICLGVWLGLMTFASFWIGTIYSYGVQLSGITAGVVILPALAAPVAPMDLAVGRVECTLIGVISVTLTTILFVPKRETQLPLRVDHGATRGMRNGAVVAVLVALGAAMALTFQQFWTVGVGLSFCLFGVILGSMPDPRPALKWLAPGVAVGVVAGLVYRMIGDALGLDEIGFFILACVFLLIGSLVRANKKTAPLGLDGNMCFLLSAEIGMPGHGLLMQSYGAIAMVVAAAIITIIHRKMLRLVPHMSVR